MSRNHQTPSDATLLLVSCPTGLLSVVRTDRPVSFKVFPGLVSLDAAVNTPLVS